MINNGRKIYFSDHLEESVAIALDFAGIKFLHETESKGQRLDFFLPEHNVYVEIKQFHSDRISEQTSLKDNVIVLQGKKAVAFFTQMLYENE